MASVLDNARAGDELLVKDVAILAAFVAASAKHFCSSLFSEDAWTTSRAITSPYIRTEVKKGSQRDFIDCLPIRREWRLR